MGLLSSSSAATEHVYPGQELNPSCPKLRCCREKKRRWSISSGTALRAGMLAKPICQWGGERWDLGHLHGFVLYCAGRQSPSLSKGVVDRSTRENPDEEHAYATVWARLWQILSNVCITSLWIQRNRVLCPKEGA